MLNSHYFSPHQEDEIVTRANSTSTTLIERIHADEIKRNRSRVSEINHLLDHAREDLYAYELNN